MMLHRHFENEKKRNENMTRLEPEDYVSDVFPPDEETEAPKRRGRPKKTED